MLAKLLDIVFDRKGERLPEEELDSFVLYYRPIERRGRDQIRCYWSQAIRWWKTGSIQNYCHSCPHYHRMSCMYGTAHDSEDCRKGHFRFEGA